MWLDKDTELEDIKELVKPYEANKMESWRVSTLVNSPRNDSPTLVKPETN